MKKPTHCLQCGRKLPELTQKDSPVSTRGVDMKTIDPDVLFCTMRCAARFGVHAAKTASAPALLPHRLRDLEGHALSMQSHGFKDAAETIRALIAAIGMRAWT